MEHYTVLKPQVIKEELHLNYSPTGLNIRRNGSRDSCTVQPIPSNKVTRRGIEVSNNLLENLFRNGVIKEK